MNVELREARLRKQLETYARQCLPDRELNYQLLADQLVRMVNNNVFDRGYTEQFEDMP